MSANASLLLTKRVLLPHRPYSGQHNNNRERFAAIARCQPSADYTRAYERWVESIQRLPGTVLGADCSVAGRMIVGIGAENVLENSITLNRLWGMPFIPGSALKGLVRHYCGSFPRGTFQDDHLLDLFGSLDYSGAVRWLDAWYVPAVNETPIMLDVITTHHPGYYADPIVPPSDFDDPTPIPFVSTKGTFLVAVQAPDREWAYAAMDLLIHALKEWGVGAKTNAGYGRMRFDGYRQDWATERRRKVDEEAEAKNERAKALAEVEERAAQARQKYQEFLDALADTTRVASLQAQSWVTQWSEIPESDIGERSRVGALILERLKEDAGMYNWITGRVLPGSKNKPKNPIGYANPLIVWMDEHAPEEPT